MCQYMSECTHVHLQILSPSKIHRMPPRMIPTVGCVMMAVMSCAVTSVLECSTSSVQVCPKLLREMRSGTVQSVKLV